MFIQRMTTAIVEPSKTGILTISTMSLMRVFEQYMPHQVRIYQCSISGDIIIIVLPHTDLLGDQL